MCNTFPYFYFILWKYSVARPTSPFGTDENYWNILWAQLTFSWCCLFNFSSKRAPILEKMIIKRILIWRQKGGRIVCCPVLDNGTKNVLCSKVVWFSTFFYNFRNWTHCCRLDKFVWVQFQKNGEVFIFIKSQGPKNLYFLKISKYLPFTSKNSRQK